MVIWKASTTSTVNLGSLADRLRSLSSITSPRRQQHVVLAPDQRWNRFSSYGACDLASFRHVHIPHDVTQRGWEITWSHAIKNSTFVIPLLRFVATWQGTFSSQCLILQVDLDAIAHNVSEYRRHVPASARVMAVVKADAYGYFRWLRRSDLQQS